MDREDIIKLAREAGVNLKDDPEKASGVGNVIVSYYDLKRFADLIAVAEREACAKVCDVLAVHPKYASDITKLAAHAIRARGES